MNIKDTEFKEIINKGYQIKFFREERDYPITGKYTAYCVSLEKNGIEILNNFSRNSHDEALDIVFNDLKVRENFFNNFS